MSDVGSRMSEVGGRKSEVRGQRTEVRGQGSEDRGQKSVFSASLSLRVSLDWSLQLVGRKSEGGGRESRLASEGGIVIPHSISIGNSPRSEGGGGTNGRRANAWSLAVGSV
ncbi:hypothetical protein GALL_199740 [mine drainage metagenome]|uniref:Uncharacterized protein n=1 Tax=mine drainage metagenome TaxID=410659 RepID=A0A1J5SCW0_9ZZZZ